MKKTKTKAQTKSLKELIEKIKYCNDEDDEENLIKYCDMAIKKCEYDLSIEVVDYYSYIINCDDQMDDSDDAKKRINRIIKYSDIFIDNYDKNEYDECNLETAKYIFETFYENLIGFGNDVWGGQSCNI